MPREQLMWPFDFQSVFYPLAGIESFPKSGDLSKSENIWLSYHENTSFHFSPCLAWVKGLIYHHIHPGVIMIVIVIVIIAIITSPAYVSGP